MASRNFTTVNTRIILYKDFRYMTDKYGKQFGKMLF